MCKAPKPPKPKPAEKPEFLRNPYLDASIGQSAAVAALRTGRSSLRIPIGSGLSIASPTATPSRIPTNPANQPPSGGDFTRGISGRGGRRI